MRAVDNTRPDPDLLNFAFVFCLSVGITSSLLKVLKKYGAPAKYVPPAILLLSDPICSGIRWYTVLWHGGLTLLQSHDIERIQKRALMRIVPHLKYKEALKTFKLTSLKERRGKHCVKLIKQMSDPSHKLNYL